MLSNREQTRAEVRIKRNFLGAAKRRKIPRQLYPKSLERDYIRHLLRVTDTIKEAFKPLLDELPSLLASAAKDRQDAGEGSRVMQLIRQAAENVRSKVRVEGIAERIGAQVADYNKTQINRQAKAALGVDLFIRDPKLSARLQGFVTEQDALIMAVGEETAAKIAKLATKAIQDGTPHPQLAEQIQAQFGIVENRAKLIARDQVGKLYGIVNADRQKALGVTRFIWRTVNDERVREEHAERDGEIFEYDNPPDDGLPGEPILCRCHAEPILSDLLGDE